jgi:hypothetical protein
VLAGQVLELKDLSPELDRALVELHGAFLGNLPHNLADFEKAALAFFDSNGDPGLHNRFFENFTILWKAFLAQGRFSEADKVWEIALKPAFDWESRHEGRQKIHKGTPFYFRAVSALTRGNLDEGYALMHQALEEDRRTTGQDFPETPTWFLVTLRYDRPNQYFGEWVDKHAQALNGYIEAYCQAYPTHTLKLDTFREKFLMKPPDYHVVFTLTYTLAKIVSLHETPRYALSNPFVGQLVLDLLFKLCVVIESAIRAKNPEGSTFLPRAAFLSAKSGFELDQQGLKEVNKAFNNDFDSTLKSLLDCSFRLSGDKVLSSGERDIAIAYGIRNRAGHDVAPTSVLLERAAEIEQSVFNVLFLCVSVLYA